MLVVFEGYHCTGKSTLMAALFNYFNNKKYYVGMASEPFCGGDIYLGEGIDNIKKRTVPPIVQTGLFKGCHEYHVEHMNDYGKLPHSIYFCDRYTYSNYAYNSIKIDEIIQPDLIFFLELDDFEFALSRSRERSIGTGRDDLDEELLIDGNYESYEKYTKETFPEIIKRYDEIMTDAENRGIKVVRLRVKDYNKQSLFEEALRHIEKHELFSQISKKN